MIVAQPAFVGVTGNVGGGTLTPIPGLAVGDWLVLVASNYLTSLITPTVDAAWGSPLGGAPGAQTFVGGSTGVRVWAWVHRWTGAESASIWNVSTNSGPAAIHAYRGCDAAYPAWFNIGVNGINTTVANGQMTTNPLLNPLQVANAGTVLLIGIADKAVTVTSVDPPPTSQTGAYTQRTLLRQSNGNHLLYVGESLTVPVGNPNITMPNGAGWTITSAMNTGMWALMLVPPTVTKTALKYAGAGTSQASGLPGEVAWGTPNNILADDDVRATNVVSVKRDSSCLRAASFNFGIPTTSDTSILGFAINTTLRANTNTSPNGNWDLTWSLTNVATGLYDSNTVQSHVQNKPAPASAGSDFAFAWDLGFGNLWGRATLATPAEVNNALWGYNLVGTQMNSSVGGNCHLEVDAMQMAIYYWQGTDITPVGGAAPLLFCEA